MTLKELKWIREAKKPGTVGYYFKEKQELALEERYKKWLAEKSIEELKEQDSKRIANSREVYWFNKIWEPGHTKYEYLIWDLCYKGIRTDNLEGLQMAEIVAKSGHGFTDEEWKEFLA